MRKPLKNKRERQAHNLKVTGSNPVPATNLIAAIGQPQWRHFLDAVEVLGGLDYKNLRRIISKLSAAGFVVKIELGIPWGRDCLRHSCASYAVPIWGASSVAGWLGHSESVLHQHYRELVTEADAREWWNILP